MTYVELEATSHFSFLRGASSPEELFAAAALLDIPALGIADRNSVAGVVRAMEGERVTGVRSLPGTRLDLRDGTSILVYPTDKAAWSRLTRLLTLGKGRAGKAQSDLDWDDLAAAAHGQIAILLAGEDRDATRAAAERIAHDFGDRAYLALSQRRRPGDALRLADLDALARATRIGSVATGDVLYHTPDRRLLQDVVTCIRLGCTIDDAGFRRERFADRHLKSGAEMARRFARLPHAIAASAEIAARCRFGLDQLAYQYPDESIDRQATPQATLEWLTWDRAPWRYPDGVPEAVTRQLHHELKLIAELKYAPYFLTVHAIVRFARSQNILCQGRGSAANSAVCYVLGITSIDPVHSNLLFERFISNARDEPPDIDVDFEHERREEVIQWIYETYGRDRAALTATVIRYRSKGAVREVGKVLGLTEDVTAALAGQVWGWSKEGVEDKHADALNLNMGDRRLTLTLDLARQLIGTPRHLSQHPGGFVLTHDRLDDLVPIEPAAMADRQVIEWDKDDIELLKFMKVDVLGLGMLGCMRRAFTLLKAHKGLDLDLALIPQGDTATYDMICLADTVGTFQIESRAQMNMLPRLKPRELYDLVIEVAIVRPGPIQGDMVHPYLRRREGKEPVDYPTPELKRVLGKTLGVPLFQEQAMQVAIVGAGFTPTEADRLRRSMATFKHTGGVGEFETKMIAGMVANGYTREFAEKTFRQIEGFGSYGFPESHAASFALIAYASSWMKCHHPDIFLAALLNAQPMGFYAPAQLVGDARAHDVEVRPVCVQSSEWDSSIEAGIETGGGKWRPVRLGLRVAKGLRAVDGEAILKARARGPFTSVEDLWRRARVPVAALERLADADAFAALGLDRRAALWAIRGLGDNELPLFAEICTVEPKVVLDPMTAGSEVVEDYRSIHLSLRAHPVSFLRETLQQRNVTSCGDLTKTRDGRRVDVAGLVLLRQKPGSAKGVMFMTIEDETGIANLVIWARLFEAQRRLILSASMVRVRGIVQREGDVIHVVARHLTDESELLRSVGTHGLLEVPHGRGDGAKNGGGPDLRDPRNRVRDIYTPDLPAIRVATRDFR